MELKIAEAMNVSGVEGVIVWSQLPAKLIIKVGPMKDVNTAKQVVWMILVTIIGECVLTNQVIGIFVFYLKKRKRLEKWVKWS